MNLVRVWATAKDRFWVRSFGYHYCAQAQAVAEDCQRMAEDAVPLDDAESVDASLQRCQALAGK